jgi:alanyl-tRNA synthetase
VDSLGQIGSITLVSEGSIGSNTRRIFAVTGFVSLERARERERLVQAAAELLRTEPDELLPAIGRLAERQRDAEKELGRLRQQSSEAEAKTLAEAAAADGGVVVARRDKVDADGLRNLAQAILRYDGVRAVVLAGSPDGASAAIVAATGGTPDAAQLVRTLGQMVRGGGGGSAEVATAGGKDASGIEAALAEAQRLLSA